MGIEQEIEVAIQRVLDVDPSSCDLVTARARLADTRRVNAFFAARQAALTAIYERLLADTTAHPGPAPAGPEDPVADGAVSSGSTSGAESMPDAESGLPPESSQEADRRRLRAKWLQRCALFADALSAGRVSVATIDVLAVTLERTEPTVVAHVLGDEAALVTAAQRATPEGFRWQLRRCIDQARGDFGIQRLERQRKASKASWWTDEDGMYRLSVLLDPERGPAMFSILDQRVGQLRRQPSDIARSEADLRLQAALDVICGDLDITPEVLVVTDERTARSGPHPGSTCETEAGVALPASIATNLCAAEKVTAAIARADGRVVALGSASRLASRLQRRALRAMYRTCAHPDCSAAFTECAIHHVEHWEHGGPTSVPNLLPLCYRHHHLVHDGGWNLTIDADRSLRWYRPDGTLDRETALQPLVDQPAARPDPAPPPNNLDARRAPPGRAPPHPTTSAAPRQTVTPAAPATLFDPTAA